MKARLPLLISGMRIVLVLLLWVWAARGWQRGLALGLLGTVFTDWLDGQLGRWLDHDSELESRIDSLADKILTLSVLAWLLWLHPSIVIAHPIMMLMVLVLSLISWLVGLWQHRSVLGLHLHVAKFAGVVQALFIVHTFWFGQYTPWLLYVAAGSWCVAACEEIAVQVRHPHIDRHTKTVFQIPNNSKD